MSTLYHTYRQKMQKIADVNHSIAVLNWDQETYLPPKAASMRAQQISTLAGISHELMVAEDLGILLEQLNEQKDLDTWAQKNITQSIRHYKKQQKFSTAFVVRESKAIAKAFQAWRKAREANDYKLYQDALGDIITIKREACEIIGYDAHPYDALLDEYEPNEKTANLNTLFADVRRKLVDFVQEIAQKPQPKDDWMYLNYDKDKQWNFGIHLLKQMGYDFNAGRQDLSAHPFTTSFGSNDVRVTTRVSENNFHEMVWSCIHEGGHALYEQGFKAEHYGLPTAEAISLGIHESQSRLWENNVGRSLLYWKANYPILQKSFPANLATVNVNDFYRSMNVVRPSFIRTNADELTYHFHILIRFEIEKALIEGTLAVKDLRDAWNEKYKEYLKIDVPNDNQGILQDIHWSHGSFGYFPTYSLGSFYAAQFYAQAVKDIPDLEDNIANGNMLPLLQWLRQNIHQYGKLYGAEEICKNITGEALNFDYFMDYARKKYTDIYNL